MFLLLLLPALACAASVDQHIVNGATVDIANYPWQVKLMFGCVFFWQAFNMCIFLGEYIHQLGDHI